MGDIVPDEGWVIEDEDVLERLEKPRTPETAEDEQIAGISMRWWKTFPNQMVGLETHGHIPRGSCVRAGLPDPWPEFEAKLAARRGK